MSPNLKKDTKKRKGGKHRALSALLIALSLIAAGMVSLIVLGFLYDSELPPANAEIHEIAAKNEQLMLSPLQRKLIDSALSLVGTVHYFWGGKSFCIGRDPEWGSVKTVTSSGSMTSYTKREYGLDCSGFVAWCFVQAGLSQDYIEKSIGIGTYHQFENSKAVGWNEIEVGDLAFQSEPDEDNHVGICIGFNSHNEPLFVHCSSRYNNVVVTGRSDFFNLPRRLSASLQK